MQASIGTIRCARSPVQLHATACHSIAMKKLCLPDASQHRHNGMCHVAKATACYSMSLHRCVQVQGTITCVPSCKRNHTRQRAVASLCTSRACLVQASIGTLKCALLQTLPHAAASLRIAVYRPKALQIVCQGAKATACDSVSQHCCVQTALPDASHHRHDGMCHVARATVCYSVPQHRCVQAKNTINCLE